MSKDKGETTERLYEGHNHDKIKSHTHHVGDPQTGEQKDQSSSRTAAKVLAPHETFQPGDPAKGLGISRESDFEGQWDLITELPQDWGKQRLLKGTNKTLCAPGPRGKEQ